MLWPGSTRAQQTPPTLDTYERQVREAFVAAQRHDRLGLEQAASELADITEVQTDEGARVPIDNTWLTEAMHGTDPDFDRIEARLGALLDALAQPETSVPPDAQQRLSDILSRPPFAEAEADDSLLDAALEWLGNVLDRLFSPVAEAGANSGSLIGWILAAICGLMLAGVLFYLYRSLRQSTAREAEAAPPGDPEAHLTATTALQEAGTLARGGDYRTAVRYLYLSSLLWLDEQGMLRYERALTNHEHLSRLSGKPDVRARLVPIIDTFDRVWYGHETLDEEAFAAYQQHVEQLRKMPR
jgi:hypothetical protein